MKFRSETKILRAIIALGLLAALVGVGHRFSVEQHNKRAEIVVDYSDATNLAIAARQPLTAILADLKTAGVTTLALWEDPLDALHQNGAMSVHEVDPAQTDLTFSAGFPGEEERVVAALRNKTSVPFQVVGDTIAVSAPYSQVSGLGIGLDPQEVQVAVDAGYLISPRLYNYSGADQAAIQWMIDQTKTLCRGRANVVIFNGPDVLGNRGAIAATAQALRGDGLLYGSLELGKQIGDDVLSRVGSDITVRVHSIGGNEMPTMDEPTATGRFALAAREREIRSCYVRLFQNGLLGEPDVLTANTDYIKHIVQGLRDGGIAIGPAHSFNRDPRPARILLALMGLGMAAGGVMLLRQFFPATGRWFLPVLIPALLIGALLAATPGVTGRLLAALLAAMIFPSLGLILYRPARTAAVSRSTIWALERGLRAYELMTLTTICGIVLVVGLLADRLLLVKVYEFLGIRLAIITPFLLQLLHEGLGFGELKEDALWAERRAVMTQRWRQIAGSPVIMGQVVIGVALAAILGVIVLRSGNDPGIGVSSSERSFRALLNKVLYVRPRTKEIFFGFPLQIFGLALYYAGRRRWYLLFACAGAIAQADLLNTFCHVHTPLLISFIRALLGWSIGTLIGVALFMVVRRYFPKTQAEPQMGYSAGRETSVIIEGREPLSTQ